MKKILFLLFLLIYFINVCYSIGLGGTLHEKLFLEPGMKKNYTLYVFSTTTVPMNHIFKIRGNEKIIPYFKINPGILFLNPKEQKSAILSIDFPYDIKLDPGKYIIDVCVEEERPATSTLGIGAKTAACATFEIYNPYPGKKIEAKIINIKNVEVGEESSVKITILNIGTENVQIYGNLYLEKDGEIIKQIQLNYFVPIKTEKIFEEKISTEGLSSGSYNVIIELNYNDKKIKLNGTLLVGQPLIKIVDYTKTLITSKLNIFEIKVKNLWNKDIENIFAKIKLLDKNNITLKEFSSEVTNINAYEEKKIISYIDTNGYVGKYFILIEINYDKRKTIEYGKIEIIKKEFNWKIILEIIGILILIGILIYLILKLIKKRKEKKYEKKRKTRKK